MIEVYHVKGVILEQLKKNVGLIGAGNMGEAFIGGFIGSGLVPASKIFITDIRKEHLDTLKKKYGVNILKDQKQVLRHADVIILAVKPQQMDQVLKGISEVEPFGTGSRKLVISIAAGYRIERMEKWLYRTADEHQRSQIPIIRVMPNTPALVLSGISGMSVNRYVTDEDRRTATAILKSIGQVIEFEEARLDAVTALSGSGPAYVFYLAESMIAAGIKVGLDADNAAKLACMTIMGAAKLMIDSDDAPAQLRQKVTSPGGTTQAALNVLEAADVKQHIIDAIAAATRRAEELSQPE